MLTRTDNAWPLMPEIDPRKPLKQKPRKSDGMSQHRFDSGHDKLHTCVVCDELEAHPIHFFSEVKQVETPTAKAEVTILTGFQVTTLLVIPVKDTGFADVGFEKEWKMVASTELLVRSFFEKHPEFGRVVRVENKGPLAVLGV